MMLCVQRLLFHISSYNLQAQLQSVGLGYVAVRWGQDGKLPAIQLTLLNAGRKIFVIYSMHLL